MRTYTPELIGALNQKTILQLIRSQGPMSRADICRQVSMSFPAVSTNVKALLDKGILRDVGAGSNAVGRKSTLLDLNADYGYIVGISLGRYGIQGILCNMMGETLCLETVQNGQLFESRETVQENLVSLSQSILEQSRCPAERVLCVSVSRPGIINDAAGAMRMGMYLPAMEQRDLESAIQQVFGLAPVLFENNVNNGALGEQWRGAGQGYHDIFYFHYGTGIGGAMILGDQLYKGSNAAAGEIAYMTLRPEHLRPNFAREGALEEEISGHAILAQLPAGDPKTQLNLLFSDNGGDPSRAALLSRLIQDTGMLFVNVAAILDPQVIVVSGSVGRSLFPLAQTHWENMLKNQVPFPPKVVCSNLRGQESLIGALRVGMTYVDQRESGGAG